MVVETISRLAQWRIPKFQALSSYTSTVSTSFKIGRWYLSALNEDSNALIRIYPVPSESINPTAIARFVLRVSADGSSTRYASPIHEKDLQKLGDFSWRVANIYSCGCFIVEIEFLDLKVSPSNDGKAISIWPGDNILALSPAGQSSIDCLSRMLDEAIHVDVTIKTEDGTLKAHKAVLSASSPVFQSMFFHNLKEKESSIIEMKDMSQEACMVFLQYLYGIIRHEELWKHRMAMLDVANKYDIPKLKDFCEESLLVDLDVENILERLQDAWLYQLKKLKKGCLSYLFKFGKIHDITDKIADFFWQADRDLLLEVFQESIRVKYLPVH